MLLVTVLGVDRVNRGRQGRERARVIAAQAAILARQAQRSVEQVQAACADLSRRDGAGEELRTYMTMLLVSAPVLIDDIAARTFLEDAQRVGGLLGYTMAHLDDDAFPDQTDALETAAQTMRESAAPLLSVLHLDQWRAVDGAGAGGANGAAGA